MITLDEYIEAVEEDIKQSEAKVEHWKYSTEDKAKYSFRSWEINTKALKTVHAGLIYRKKNGGK